MSKNGLHLITPTSIASTGTSATINANGSVSFSGLTNLELRGVFSTDYDNYIIVMRTTQATTNANVLFRLLAGTTPATGANYTRQYLYASSTTVSGARVTGETSTRLNVSATTQPNGFIANIYGPFLAQPTALRTVTVQSESSATIEDYASTHSLSTSYDGCVIYPSAGSFSGLVAVYGMRK